MKRIRLRTRFIILFAGVVGLSLISYSVWSNCFQQQQAQREMHEKAYILSQQLAAVWEFISINQDLINYDANGMFNFKGLHCSLVGKSIGKLFGKKTDYVIRYVNNNPRNPDDFPDWFEGEALELFYADKNVKEVYKIAEYKGVDSFRYVVPMTIDETCLGCHGGPAGERDVLGYSKEGWDIGDLAGVLSIVMPIELYVENTRSVILRETTFFMGTLILFMLIVYYATARLVTNPIHRLKLVTEELRMGNLDIRVNADEIDAQGEIRELTEHFDSMINELRTLYNDLEVKVDLRTQDLARANNILEQQQQQLEKVNNFLKEDNEYKSEFLAIMSHELRTPLTSIIAFTDLMDKALPDRTEKIDSMLHEVKINGQTLLALINNILDMARIQAGRTELQLEQVDLVDVINAVEAVVEPIAQMKKLRLFTNVDDDIPVVRLDREKMRRIVENLVSNAIKFTPEGGRIEVGVEFNVADKNIIINVTDDGIGIGRGHLDLIFDKFVQGDSSIQRPYNGSGLGLALTRELVEMHGGNITVKSELGKGSTFTVTIPVTVCEEETHENNAGR